MPTLYVENVPEGLYDALKSRARQHGKSISAEVLTLLADNIPTEAELSRRRELVNRSRKLRSKRVGALVPHLTAEEMQREDRYR